MILKTIALEGLHGAQVIRVGDEEILLAFRDQLVENARVEEGVVQVTVAGRVPILLVRIGTRGARKKCLLEDTRVARLVEGGDAKLLVGILLDDAEGIFVCVEGGHEDEGNVNTVSGVEVFDLADGKVEEGHVVLDLERTLRTSHT